ncbi:hypothetical protein FB567DRAFT_530978 [Paraphoma chrysanthemicola]|uniref:BZIP domain-containing protein n=1 Tax=Paraphoma chrysanthemicola TaxID=798071 RepID=A0A8K0VWZ6_9PLEO|nr:hypothetical protein FB567DRAFT_530978 [Paraphoma chrysanthemicola]
MSPTTLHAQRQHVPYLEDIVNVDDDWRGVGDASARRKRQNRLNVRAYRRRKAMASSHDSRAVRDSHYASAAAQPSLLHWIERHQTADFLLKRERLPNQSILPMDMPASTSIVSAVFPLSPDHLITLVQFNALRGSLANRQLLDAAMSVDAYTTPSVGPTGLHVLPKLTNGALEILPRSLHPTETQRTISHPHWVDIIPHPNIRDNLINAIGNFDEHLLWSEIVGGLFLGFESKSSQMTHGAVMWDTPWYWEGWELGESVVLNWAWALKGCDDVLLATNYWREKRGEKRLVIKS